MNAIIGKIVSLAPGKGRRAPAGLKSLAVRFKPAALLPERADPPAWLVDQVLTVDRQVADVREIGGQGDAIALTPDESEKWLLPLTIEPASIEGKLPRNLELALRWWKNDKPPEFTISALGQAVTGKFTRRGDHFVATVPLADLHIPDSANRPFEIEAACEALRAVCPVLPASAPAVCRYTDLRGSGFRLCNEWYAVDLSSSAGGAIIGWRERGRYIDHLASTAETQRALEMAGYSDRLLLGGADKLSEAKMAFTLRQHEAGAIRVDIAGLIDESKNLHSSAAYRLLDGLPILQVQRNATLGEPKPDEKKKPKEKIESVVPLQLGFRYASLSEGDGRLGSQVVALDGNRLGVIRACYENDFAHRGDWWLRSGWAMVHHPLRRQVALFCFEEEHPPELLSWAGSGYLTFETYWLLHPYRPPAGVGFSLAMSVGEAGGAAIGGAWVACRTLLADGTLRCAAVAKLASPDRSPVAEFRLGRQNRRQPMEAMFLQGVGQLHIAVADFPKGKMSDPFDAQVAGIASRGIQ